MTDIDVSQSADTQNRDRLEHDDSEISVIDILQTIVDNLRLLILLPIVIGAVAYGVSLAITPTYIATTKFLPPQQQQSAAAGMLQSLGALSGLAAGGAGIKNPTDQYIAFLETRSITDALVERFNLQERYSVTLKEVARRELQRNTKTSGGKENIITVEFEDKDAEVAAKIANAYVEELSHMLSRMAVTEAQQRRAFFELQLKATKDNLVRAEQVLAASGVSAAALNANPSTALEGPAKLRALVTAQEVKLAAMRSYLAPGAQEYRQGVAELAALRNQLLKAEQQQPSASPGSNDYIAKYREFKYQETLFEMFSKQYEVAKIDESRDAVIQVLDLAVPPEQKAKPRKLLIALGVGVVSGFLLLIFIFVRQALRSEGRNAKSAAKMSKLKRSFARALGRG